MSITRFQSRKGTGMVQLVYDANAALSMGLTILKHLEKGAGFALL